MLYDLIVSPFADYSFMRRALAACFALSLGGAPLGVFMMLRRMTLAGDAMSHAILPGVAIAFAISGLDIWAMTLGGFAASLIVAIATVSLTRFSVLKEDAALSLFYLLSLASGVVIVSIRGGNVDLLHLLFGNILAVNNETLVLMNLVSLLSLAGIAVFYRWFVVESFDPEFLRATTKWSSLGSLIFYCLLMINLVAAFQALGTLMALGLILLPAVSARFWSDNIDVIVPLSVLLAVLASIAGLLVSFYVRMPSGPAVVLMAGVMGLVSASLGSHGSVRCYVMEKRSW